MARSELVRLEPVEVALTGRQELDIHKGPIMVAQGGPDWGDAAIQLFMAEQETGEKPVDFRWPNRQITIPLVLGVTGDFDAARIALQAWCAQVNTEGGGTLKRELLGGSYGEAGKRLFCDVVKATLKLGADTEATAVGLDANAELQIEALPEFYGDVKKGAVKEATGYLTWLEQIIGNMPARVESLTATDKSGANQMGLAWHFRRRHYNPAATAAPIIEAEALTPLDSAAEVALTGASGGKVIKHSNLPTTWVPVVGTNLKAGTPLSHEGVYEVFARVQTTSPTSVWLRLLWDVGDFVSPSEDLLPVEVPGSSAFYVVSLGQINLERAPFGVHRWQGALQARGQEGGENVAVDVFMFECGDEGSGVMSSPRRISVPLSGFTARERFLQSAGALTGKTAETGGKVYAALTGSDTDDFVVDAGKQQLVRSAVSDSGTAERFSGRAVGLPVALGDQAAEFTFTRSGESPTYVSQCLLLRASSAKTMVIVTLYDSAPDKSQLFATVAVEGKIKAQSSAYVPSSNSAGVLMAAIVGDDLFVYLNGQPVRLTPTVIYPRNYPLSTLPVGGAYILDEQIGAKASTRTYDNFNVWVPTQDAVIFGNQSARLSYRGAYRDSPDGAGVGPIAFPLGDPARLPVSGPEGAPVEIALRPSRGDFKLLPDSALDPFAGSLDYRPCWSHVPGTA